MLPPFCAVALFTTLVSKLLLLRATLSLFGVAWVGDLSVWIEIVSRNVIFKVVHHGECTLFLKYCCLSTKLYFVIFKAVTAVLLKVQGVWDVKLCV